MIPYFVLSLLVAAVAAQDNVPSSNNQQSFDNMYQTLELNQEQMNAAQDGENRSVGFLAYMQQLGVNKEQLSCKSVKVDPQNIKFTLYSMPTKTLTWTGNESGRRLLPYFDPKLPTQILISGRLQTEEVFQPEQLAFTYGVRGNKVNMITVNWNDYANCPYALTAILTVPQIAAVISDMIQNSLVAVNQASYDQIRMTGFGFGAHIAGLAARKLPEPIQRITALDPAGMIYNVLPQSLKLKKGDAKFIDTIMTNQGVYGLSELVGDINFMPSGGRVQKACEKLTLGKNACSHQLAIEYFVESVDKSTYGFLAKPADSWAEFLAQKTFINYPEVMGEGVSQKRFGNYYLDVNASPPYSKGANGAYLFDKNNKKEPAQLQQA